MFRLILAVLLIRFAALAASSDGNLHIVVAPDGSGDFKTIQMAIDHAPTYGNQRLVLDIRPGVYHERIMLPQDRPRVTFLGTDAAKTILTYDAGASSVGGTFFSESVDIQGPEFEAANITFENSHGTGTQAVAIAIHSDRAVFERCRFLGWQDTLYAASGRQYFRNCYIEGHVDFIFGNAAAVFENCEIHSKGAGYIAAVSRTTPGQATGYVFIKCRLTGANTGKGVFLGRPWRPYARVVYVDCSMDDSIRPEGWDPWGKPENEKTAWFAEYRSTGPGAKENQRVQWSHQLTAAEVDEFRPDNFLRGADNWNPTQVPIP